MEKAISSFEKLIKNELTSKERKKILGGIAPKGINSNGDIKDDTQIYEPVGEIKDIFIPLL